MFSQVVKQSEVRFEVDFAKSFDAQLLQVGKHGSKNATKGGATGLSSNK